MLFDGRNAQFLDGRGPPLGLFADAAFNVLDMELPAAALLVLCSDGVLDALPEHGLAAKRERLLQSVQHRTHRTGAARPLVFCEEAYPTASPC